MAPRLAEIYFPQRPTRHAGTVSLDHTAPRAGTYFARVDSAGGSDASRTYALRFRMLKKGVVVLSQHAFLMSNGHVSTMAELKNNTNGWRRIQSVYIEMVDANGRRLMTDLSTLSNIVGGSVFVAAGTSEEPANAPEP